MSDLGKSPGNLEKPTSATAPAPAPAPTPPAPALVPIPFPVPAPALAPSLPVLLPATAAGPPPPTQPCSQLSLPEPSLAKTQQPPPTGVPGHLATNVLDPTDPGTTTTADLRQPINPADIITTAGTYRDEDPAGIFRTASKSEDSDPDPNASNTKILPPIVASSNTATPVSCPHATLLSPSFPPSPSSIPSQLSFCGNSSPYRPPRPGLLLSSLLHAATALPLFPQLNMTLRLVPTTPRVISPSPTPSERARSQDPEQQHDSYFGPVTRSVARRRRNGGVPRRPAIEKADGEDPEHPDLGRARIRSRSPMTETPSVRPVSASAVGEQVRKKKGSRNADPPSTSAGGGEEEEEEEDDDDDDDIDINIDVDIDDNSNNDNDNDAPPADAAPRPQMASGLLAPPPTTPGYWNPWRELSRSPSPLGLIPIHRHWRKFIHKHEVPRKALHVSIGFLSSWLYATGTQPLQVTPWLMGVLVPIATVDYLRLHWQAFNRVYVRVLGAFMREAEFSGYNGVIFYLVGAWAALTFLPKDVGMTAVLLLSWCDTAASTFGRLYGRHTPRLRRGKSLAGSLAAFLVGIATSALFWGWLAPITAARLPGNDHTSPLMFQGLLRLPSVVCDALGWDRGAATVSGSAALALLSVWSGFAAAASEVVDLFGLDDNLTIPVLSGVGIWGFLRVFG